MSVLINCGACGTEISLEAVACPKCGHPNKLVALAKAAEKKGSLGQKKVGCCGSVGIIVFALFFIGTIVSSFSNSKNSPTPTTSNTPPPPPKPKTEAEIKLEKLNNRLSAKFGPPPEQSGWDGSYSEVSDYLKYAANDPDSIKIEACTKVSYDEKVGWLVGCDYRGKNAFGGLIKNSNWFVIKNRKVVKMLPANSYK